MNLSLRNKNAFLHSSQLNFFSFSRRIKRGDRYPPQRCKTAIRLSRSLLQFHRTVRWPGISSVQPPPPVRTKDIRIRGILLCEWDAFSTRTKVRFFGESQAKWYIYIYVWYIHRLRSTSLDTYAAVYTRSMATPFPFFSTRHRFIRLPVWKKIARPRTSFWTTDTFTDFFHGSLRFRKRFKPTSSRHFRTSNLTFVSIFDPSSIFLFLFFFFFFFF